MPSLDKPPHAGPPVSTTTVKWRFPSVHPEGRKYVMISAAITLVAYVILEELGFLMLAVTAWVATFFRDPVRVTLQGEGIISAPADGLVTMIERVPVPREIAGPDGLNEATRVRVSIFMSVFDVHINRAPITGTIRQVVYIAGKFLNADLDKASEENERQYFLIEGTDGTKVGFTQIAGLIARRIIGFVREGSMVGMGQRVGLIRFGSRVDVFLPDDYAPQVALGQRCIAGETLVGLKGAPAAQGVAQ